MAKTQSQKAKSQKKAGMVKAASPVRSDLVTLRGKDLATIVSLSNAAFAAADVLTGPVTPANTALFSRVSELASQYEEYKFTKLVIHYVATCPDSVNGQVVMGWDANSEDIVGSVPEVLGLERHCITSVFRTASMSVPAMGGFKYIVKASSSRLLSHGRLTFGVQSNTTIDHVGAVWVEYEVQLKGYSGRGSNAQIITNYPDSTAGPLATTGENQVTLKQSGLSYARVVDSARLEFVTPGCYLVASTYVFTGTAGARYSFKRDLFSSVNIHIVNFSIDGTTYACTTALEVPAVGNTRGLLIAPGIDGVKYITVSLSLVRISKVQYLAFKNL